PNEARSGEVGEHLAPSCNSRGTTWSYLAARRHGLRKLALRRRLERLERQGSEDQGTQYRQEAPGAAGPEGGLHPSLVVRVGEAHGYLLGVLRFPLGKLP